MGHTDVSLAKLLGRQKTGCSGFDFFTEEAIKNSIIKKQEMNALEKCATIFDTEQMILRKLCYSDMVLSSKISNGSKE